MWIDSELSSIDQEILDCLDLDKPKSFFLFAGAGSGKTRSLVEVLKAFRFKNSHRLKTCGRKIAIITYTNAACDEIKRRLDFDSIFVVSTIHSFSWELIKSFQQDIKSWIKINIEKEICNLEAEQAKGRSGTKTARSRERKIELKRERLNKLDKIKKFTYNPNGVNDSKDSLSHTEVIGIASDFISLKPLMQSILIRKYPIILIDESQDTKKELIDAFFNLQSAHSDKLTLGLFGDMMQRIYSDGKVDLGYNLPDSWMKPAKKINYRCPKRILKLINKIRSCVDTHIQESQESSEEGIVRLFLINTTHQLDKEIIEKDIAERMALITADELWKPSCSEVKVLTLEHHMAASRGGFFNFFESLYRIDKYKTGLLDGSLPGISFFAVQVIPLIRAVKARNEYKIAQIVKKYSPLLYKQNLKGSKSSVKSLVNANEAVKFLSNLLQNDPDPSLLNILENISQTNLFTMPEDFLSVVAASKVDNYMAANPSKEEAEATNEETSKIEAWLQALNCSFSEFESYEKYISDYSPFGTHQGVKGLEYPRVMVIIDDEEAKGFLFSYEKLFGAKEESKTDCKKILEGKETSIDRTRRLFYVTCSRAEKSLAIVAYSNNPESVKNHVIKQQWFSEEEILEWPIR